MPNNTPFKVFVVSPDAGVGEMFIHHGWQVVDSIDLADLVQFTGGADVDPALYGEARHPTTQPTPARDRKEILITNYCWYNGKKMAGICRGGQFLNVMCGGKLYQDVEGHRGEHAATVIATGERIVVTSTHHQMMIPHEEGQVLIEANLGKRKTKVSSEGHSVSVYTGHDVEAVIYPKKNAFCFQPHPEFNRKGALAKLYMHFIENKLLKGE